MDKINKVIFREVITGLTATTQGYKYIIIPNTGITYNVKFLLTTKNKNLGHFRVDTTGTTITNNEYNEITGQCSTRLSELEKYTITEDVFKKYYTGGSINNNGVVVDLTIPNQKIVYYIDGIKYVDILSGETSGITFNIYKPQGITNISFNNNNYYKNIDIFGNVDNPEIDNDVFIVRDEKSVLENNYKLEYIKNLRMLYSYIGGNYFKINKNI